MARQTPLSPMSCAAGFMGRYVVAPGDTLYTIAQIFRVSLETLYVNNRHIPDPNYLVPGDVLCVPSNIPIPCCVQLRRRVRLPFGAGAVAYVNFGPQGGQSVNVLATLPEPAVFGNYDMYITTALIADTGGFGNELFPTREGPPTWASRIDLPTAASLTTNTRVIIQPANSETEAEGPVIFENTLQECDCRVWEQEGNIRRVLLSGTGNAPTATGFAHLMLNPAQVQIVALNLPKPASLGDSYRTYRAWIIDSDTQNRFRIDMQRTRSSLWIGQAFGGSITGSDTIRVTAEPIPGASSPTGPAVLFGNLTGC